mmetsp:Transcript_2995/g.4549  ORF Transcript_2995/g.4549 Transcript_2995/m.4549 type:complete len:186 (-) Transcript_2995:134-691(-)|eukprot:CAMPEP_0185027908 /NCGR_PEP_ID=MMETSP1103-20130426/13219_1 /TAXON_ID=36769 /ORGANISM="Paraphysomonas bandaiensis, Strain Caron Lab Isolate" /LENGTH=185 /DNA_ID=CAMNT_0027562091 /DNA_START=9 /DNA_END=569 /DNA_ORIENTATION=+
MTHPLQNTWVLWVQTASGSYGTGDELCEFNTVEDFWKYWSFIPRLSELAAEKSSNDKSAKDNGVKSIGGFCVFKKGIRPEWEDPVNAAGSELVYRHSRNIDLADVYWENLVLGLIAETIDEGDEICGCRVTYKTKSNIKLEVWLRTKNTEIVDRIKVRMLDALTDGESSKPNPPRGLPDFMYRPH